MSPICFAINLSNILTGRSLRKVQFLKRCGILALKECDKTGFAAACQRHGLTFHRNSPWTAELRRRFDLK